MAEFIISYDDAKIELPSTCMCCGQPAVVHDKFRFIWMPHLIVGGGLLSAVHLAINASQLRTVEMNVPLCERHIRTLRWSRALSKIGKLIVAIAVIGSVLIVASMSIGVAMMNRFPNGRNPFIWVFAITLGLLVFLGVPLLIVWAIVGLSVGSGVPRIRAAGDRFFVMANVAPAFVEEFNRLQAARGTPTLAAVTPTPPH